jgi:hypothetical protein
MGHSPLFSVWANQTHAIRPYQYIADIPFQLPRYVALSEVNAIIYLTTDTNFQSSYNAGDAAARMVGISVFFASVADIFILLCLVDLALSSLGALGNNSPHYKIIRYCTFVIMAALFVLAIAGLGEDESFTTDLLDGSNADWTKTGKLYGADTVLYWIASLGLVFLAIFVLYSSMRKQQEQSVSKSTFDPTCFPHRFHLSLHLSPFSAPSNFIHQDPPLAYLCHIFPAHPPLLRRLPPQPPARELGILLCSPLRNPIQPLRFLPAVCHRRGPHSLHLGHSIYLRNPHWNFQKHCVIAVASNGTAGELRLLIIIKRAWKTPTSLPLSCS